MIRPISSLLRLLALLLLMVPAGCIHVAKNLSEEVEIVPSDFRPFVQYQVAANFYYASIGFVVFGSTNKLGRGLMNDVLDRWKDEGWITGYEYVNQEGGDFSESAELRLVLGGGVEMLTNETLDFVSGLTLFLIPSSSEQLFDLSLSATRADLPGRAFSAAANAGIVEFRQIFLLPLAPVAPLADGETMRRISDLLYVRLQEQGAFADPAPGIR